MNIFFSIIIPVYNTEQYLPRVLNSILIQRFELNKVEVVIVNDASPKKRVCKQILQRYRETLLITYVEFNENQGSHMARKVGVKKAIGKYITFIDPDDFLERNALKILYDDIIKNGDVECLEFNFYEKEYFKKFSKPWLKGSVGRHTSSILPLDYDYILWNKCYLASFIKPIWNSMPCFYCIYNEDHYALKLIFQKLKTSRMIDKALWVHVLGIGITTIKKCSEQHLKKILISIYNTDKYLSDFYKNVGWQEHLPFIKKHSNWMYVESIERVGLRTFLKVAKEILPDFLITEITISYALRLEDKMIFIKKIKRFILPIKPAVLLFIKFYRKVKSCRNKVIGSSDCHV